MLELRESEFIPEGFKLVAVGERCATPTDSIDRLSQQDVL